MQAYQEIEYEKKKVQRKIFP